ncbi:hypothetical protein HPB52_019971 [Rhipicephalus sanguineus]|uniref:Uncharacterized protein n=1 Tax=Rhipicephalus sanguineus TaxID=34632 RepID=A0A9D4TBF1_RHISA|nr:hypothetical protein HPB52_019971 [Rhipicephalus sanguineus]
MEVEGELLTPEEFSKDSGWKTVAARRSRAKSAPVERAGAISTGANPNDDVACQGRRDRGRAKAKIIRGGRMPPLPKDDAKIIVRPRGGLNISKVGPTVVAEAIWNAVGIDSATRDSDTMCPNFQQNIMVVSTPSRENATRYVKIECIAVGGRQHEVNAYEAAPHSTCKGVIRGIAPSDGPEELDRKIVNSKNPQALGAKRIKNTGTVVVVFDGYKVPNYVSYGADVCPCPDEAVCRGCGIVNPDEQHKCDPKCRLCGGRHLTAAKKCKERYHTPYLVRRRRGERSRDNRSKSPAFTKDDRQFPAHAGRSASCGSSRSRSPSPPATSGPSERRSRPRRRTKSRGKSGSRGKSSSRSRSVSRTRSGSSVGQQKKRKSNLTWADKLRGGCEAGPSRGPGDPLPEQARDIESSSGKASVPITTEVPIPSSDSVGAPKRMPLSSKEESGSQTNEIKGMLATLTTSVQQLQQSLAQVQVALGDPKRGLGKLADRMDALERRCSGRVGE